MTPLVLVGCGDAKADHATPARDLYTSSYFALKRAYAEQATAWRILSAKHGLVHPETELDPYDLSLGDLEREEISAWAIRVVDDLTPLLASADVVEVLAGQDYVTPLREWLVDQDVEVRFPFDDTSGLFEQMRWLKANTPVA